MTEIIELINSVGFPIVAAAALYKMNLDSVKRYDATLNEIQSVIRENTAALNVLIAEHRSGTNE